MTSALDVVAHFDSPSATTIPSTLTSPVAARVVTDPSSGQLYAADELDVQLALPDSDRAAADNIERIAAATDGVLIGADAAARIYQLVFPLGAPGGLAAAKVTISQMPGVTAVTRQFLVARPETAIPNDYGPAAWNDDHPSGHAWGLEMIHADRAWDTTTGSDGVAVGIVDDHFNPEHEDLLPNVKISGGATSPFDYHGSHVAGIACAAGNNGKGIAGVAWRCGLDLYSYTTASTGKGGVNQVAAASVLEGMLWQIRHQSRVVNMSLGFIANNACDTPPSDSLATAADEVDDFFARAVDYGRQRADGGPLWVVSAGNDCRSAALQAPAELADRYPDNVLAVSAVNSDGTLANFSSFGPTAAVAAPGGDDVSKAGEGPDQNGVWSVKPDPLCLPPSQVGTGPELCPGPASFGYGLDAGTSMAAPYVTGLAALVFARQPAFRASQVLSCIVQAAQRAGRHPALPATRGVPGVRSRATLADLARTWVIDAPGAVTCSETQAAADAFTLRVLADPCSLASAQSIEELHGEGATSLTPLPRQTRTRSDGGSSCIYSDLGITLSYTAAPLGPSTPASPPPAPMTGLSADNAVRWAFDGGGHLTVSGPRLKITASGVPTTIDTGKTTSQAQGAAALAARVAAHLTAQDQPDDFAATLTESLHLARPTLELAAVIDSPGEGADTGVWAVYDRPHGHRIGSAAFGFDVAQSDSLRTSWYKLLVFATDTQQFCRATATAIGASSLQAFHDVINCSGIR